MKALSMTPPFGQLIRDGEKTIETRTWSTKDRGPVLFCCAKQPKSLEAGMALCVAELVAVRPMQAEDVVDACWGMWPDDPELSSWLPGRFSWELENVRPVQPFPIKGHLGFFEVDDLLINYIEDTE